MNGRIFWVCAMECMCAQTRPQFILSFERVFEGNIEGFQPEWCISTIYHALDIPFWSGTLDIVRTHVNSKAKIPSTGGSGEDRTHNAASSTTASLTHHWLSYSSPLSFSKKALKLSKLLVISTVQYTVKWHICIRMRTGWMTRFFTVYYIIIIVNLNL